MPATMTETKDGPSESDTAVKIDSEVVRQAKIVAAYRDQSLAEYLSSTLGPRRLAGLGRGSQQGNQGKGKGR